MDPTQRTVGDGLSPDSVHGWLAALEARLAEIETRQGQIDRLLMGIAFPRKIELVCSTCGAPWVADHQCQDAAP